MALNITLAGTVFNSAGTAIDANVQVFAYNKNNGLTKWSNIRVTEATDYNINIGDPDLSGQDNTLGLTDAPNEFALIAVWTQDSEDRMTPASEFAFIVHELSGQEVYIQNIQLGLPSAITCENWTLPTNINVNDTIIALNNNSNELSYDAYGVTHYLYKKYFDINELIFSYMGTCSEEYDFGEGYSSSNVFVPSTGGDLLVKIKISDCFGNTSECQKTTKVYYSVNSCFDYSPSNISSGDELFLTSCVSGDTEQISEIKYTVNGVDFIGADVSLLIEDYGAIEVTQCVTYFDGYVDQVICTNQSITMDNIPPEINLIVAPNPDTNDLTNDFDFAHNGTDIDGTIESVKWEIWRDNPDSDGNSNWSLYYSTGLITDLSNWRYDFTDLIGSFKVIATVYDNLGASASQEYILDEINCKDPITPDILCFENMDWNKKVNVIDFSISITELKWELKIVKIPWEVKIIKIPWDMKPKIINFDPLIKKILFTYKLTDIGRPGFL